MRNRPVVHAATLVSSKSQEKCQISRSLRLASRDKREPAPKWAPETVERSPYGPLDVGDELFSPPSTSGGRDSEVRQRWQAYSEGAFGSVEPNVKTAAGAEDTARAYGVLPRRVMDDYDDVNTSVRPRIIDAETIISFAAAAASPAKFESSEVPTAKRVDPSPPPRRALDFARYEASAQRARTGLGIDGQSVDAEMAKEQARRAAIVPRAQDSPAIERGLHDVVLYVEVLGSRSRRGTPASQAQSPPSPAPAPVTRPASPPDSPPRTYAGYRAGGDGRLQAVRHLSPASEPALPATSRRAHRVAGSGASLDTLETLVEALHAAEDRVKDVEAENAALGNDLYAASVVMEEMEAECAALGRA